VLDLNRTVQLIKGALFDAEATWHSYLPEAGNWQKTAFLLTGPLIVLSAVLAYLIGFLGADASAFGFRPTIASTLLSIVAGAVAAVVVALIVSVLAGLFGGKGNFAHGLAATSLAFVPGYLGQALGWLPWIGWLVALGFFVYALVLFWRIIPIYLEVPDSKRVGHFILSLLATIVVMFLISMLLRPIIGPDLSDFSDFSDMQSSDSRPSGIGGIMGEAMRQGELMAAAEEDRYAPPSDGKLDEHQVEEYIRVMSRATEIMEQKGARMRELAERAEQKEQMSMSDMSEMMARATQMMGMNTIELEVVKSGGGNWAEYQWVKEALRTAYVQKDINEAVEHNYELYKEYEDELQSFVAR
jgi:hypothetical protein